MITFLFALLVAGVSIALVLLCTLIVAISWYAWRKSQVSPLFFLWIFVTLCIICVYYRT